VDGTDIAWSYPPSPLDAALIYFRDRPVMTYGIPKFGVKYWSPKETT